MNRETVGGSPWSRLPDTDFQSRTDRPRSRQRRTAHQRPVPKGLPAGFPERALAAVDDQARWSSIGARLAFTTDAFVVRPIFFPGGDIGKLAVHGTVNDLAMGGAKPLFIAGGVHPGGRPADRRPAAHRRIDATGLRRRARAAGHRRHQGRRPRQGRRRVHHHVRHGHVPASRISSTGPVPATRFVSAAPSAITAWRSCPSGRISNSRGSSRATRLR